MALEEKALSPYPQGSLPVDHQTQIEKIREQLVTWRDAANRTFNHGLAPDALTIETERLAAFEVAPPYAFTPEPPYRFRRVLLSCIRCYWLALVATCSAEERDELAARLNAIPPYGNRIPQFDGRKCVDKPGDLSAQEYEGLMRTIHLVVLGMPRLEGDIRDSWDELGEVGVQTWEERD